jgi:hypothetical protein
MIFSLLLASCSSERTELNHPSGRVGIYVRDMMDDIEFRYRIIRLVDLTNEKTQLIDSDINLDLPENQALSDEIFDILSDESIHDEKELIGRDVALLFRPIGEKAKFWQQGNPRSVCYLFYLKGHFIKGDEFLVEDYQAIPAWPKCIEDARNTYNTFMPEDTVSSE